MSDTISPWLNAKQAGTYLGRSPTFVLREIRNGRLRATRIGGRGEVLTRSEWLDAYVQDRAEAVSLPSRRRAG